MAEALGLRGRRRPDAGGQRGGPLDRLDQRRGVGAGGLVHQGSPRLAHEPGPPLARGRRAARRAGVDHRRRRSRRRTRCCSCGSRWPRPRPTPASTGPRSIAWPPVRPAPPICPCPGRTRPGRCSPRLLSAGRPAIDVIEALDQRGLFVRILPEWEPVRSRPQRNAYHRFTVDRHLCETAANASALVDRVERPDLLVVGALLHDIGKGYPGDHTEVGIVVVRSIGERMGYPVEDIEVLQDMVRHHLLLPDVATRRDLSDEGTIALRGRAGGVAQPAAHAGRADRGRLAGHRPGGVEHLEGRAGGRAGRPGRARPGRAAPGRRGDRAAGSRPPSSWPAWARVAASSRDSTTSSRSSPPTAPACSAGWPAALALNGLDVLSAAAHTDDAGMALESYRVESSLGPVIPWDRVIGDVEKALDGRLALEARLRRTGPRVRPSRAHAWPRPASRWSPSTTRSPTRATVVEVRAPDEIGVLYRITRAIADLDLDIRSAKVQSSISTCSTRSTCATATGTRSSMPTTCASSSGRSSRSL